MKSLISLAMVMLLAVSMMQLAVAQYSGKMNTKLLYGVAKEVRSGVRYGMITMGEGLQSANTNSRVPAKQHRTARRKPSAAKRTTHKSHPYTPQSRYAHYKLR